MPFLSGLCSGVSFDVQEVRFSSHWDDVDDLTGPPFSGQSSAFFYHFMGITCLIPMEMIFAAFHSAFVTAHFAVNVKLTTCLSPQLLQHRRTHDQDWSYRQCHRQSVDLGCYSSSILECCLVLWSLWPFLVSSCLSLSSWEKIGSHSPGL